jgi:hypothetical protein
MAAENPTHCPLFRVSPPPGGESIYLPVPAIPKRKEATRMSAIGQYPNAAGHPLRGPPR